MSHNEMIRMRVQGRVQGIGYRYFVQDTGNSLHVTGWVRNLSDGSVEIEAQGPSAVLDRFIETVRNEHPYARIDDVAIERSAAGDAAQAGFSIKF
jgi:acylphosphatase